MCCARAAAAMLLEQEQMKEGRSTVPVIRLEGIEGARETELLHAFSSWGVWEDLECEPCEHDFSHFNFGESPSKEGKFAQRGDIAIPDCQGFAVAVRHGPLEDCRRLQIAIHVESHVGLSHHDGNMGGAGGC